MDIIWHGNTCFTIKGKTATLVINPDESIKTSLRGEVVLSSLEEEKLAEVKDAKKTLDWPGEYEISGVAISALSAWTRSRTKEDEGGEKGDKTLIFRIEMDGVGVCHLGGLGHKLTTEMVEEIGDVDVLMVPVGEKSNLTGKTEEVVEQIDPRVVILMGDENPENFAKELKAAFGEKQQKYTISSVAKLPEDKTDYIILEKV